ncbi:hypothetical protein BS47DRAFT_1371079 [Hydnum rufescens UP504]|uniref:DUF3533 domain-containing protein n=1 Tax=Hydnum rufescens UP504 TaxID=1448309 RepID=A0A9P6B757_9AGAM|nr:hypothetical protein BS47DRAFT_1371079 [Hydnum rufescens UP504]
MVLIFFLTFAFMWICVPVYFGSLAHQRSYTDKLRIWFIDMDGSDIGNALRAAVQANINSPTKAKLGWVIEDPSKFSGVDDVAHQVVEERAWAAVVGTRFHFSRVDNLDIQGGVVVAVTLFVDTARNELATNNYIVPYSAALLSSAIAQFSTVYAAQYFSAQSGNATALRAITAAPQTITVPVAFSLANLRPFSAPVATALTLVGSIYVIIFAFVVTMAGYLLRAPIEPHLTLKQLILLRLTEPILLYIPLSFGFSMISLCFKVPFNAKFTHAGGFFLYWVFVFLSMTALGLSTEAMVTLLTPRFMTYFLFPLIISNVSVASVPIILEPWFYKSSFSFTSTLLNSNLGQATRTLIFNTKSHLGLNAGVLISWLVLSFITLPFFGDVEAASKAG